MTFDRYYGGEKRGVGVLVNFKPADGPNAEGFYYTAYVVEDGEVADLLQDDKGPYPDIAHAHEAAYNEAEMWCLDEGIEMEETR